MSDLQGPDREEPDKRQFIREKIVKQRLSKRQIAKRALALFFVAILFGVIAAVSFVLTRPLASRLLGLEPTTESVPISFTKDEPETTAPTTVAPTESETLGTEPIEEILQSAAGKLQFTTADIKTFYETLYSVSQKVDKGIVTVYSAKQEMDWFGNPIVSSGQYAGAVVARTNGEYLVLTTEAAVSDTDAIRVSFSDGAVANGSLRQTDKILGMAVVTVAIQELPEVTRTNVAVLNLGNSYSVKQGDMIIGVGSPAGVVHSSAYGTVSYVARNVQAVDGVARVFYSGIAGDSQRGTFYTNLEGDIIGWSTDQFKGENSPDVTSIYSVSDYKGVLEKLTNGISAPYFGVKGQEVTTAMVESGTPEGVYVVSAESDGPAYDAGIQNGDIITRIGSKEITTVKDLQTQVENMVIGENVNVVVQRYGREEYKELEYQVNIRAR